MKALIKTETGIEYRETNIPEPSHTEVLVQVRASSLNRADLFLVDGKSHGQHGGPGTALGLEWSGVVMKVGAQVPSTFRVGDSIMCSGLGGFAEYAVTDWRRAFPIPAHMNFETAACLPVALRTSHTALIELGALEKGQSVLVLGASSGVGLMTMQVAKELGAGLVIGTSTKKDRRERLKAFGADFVIDSNATDWADQVLNIVDGRGVDLSIDFLAGPLINEHMRAVKIAGRIVNVGRLAGDSDTFDFDRHALRRIQYFGMTFRTRSAENVGDIAVRVQEDLWGALQKDKLHLPIDVRLPYERAAEAFDIMRNNTHFGKIVLTRDQAVI